MISFVLIKILKMGCTGTAQRNKIITPHNIGKTNFKYPTKVRLQIKIKDATGRTTGTSPVNIDFTTPFLCSSENLTSPLLAHVSRCVLPGLDPRKENEKKCQDNCLYILNGDSTLLALFDGHGKDGEKVAALCTSFVEEFYKENHSNFADEPIRLLEEICNTCDFNVKKPGNGIDASSSGR